MIRLLFLYLSILLFGFSLSAQKIESEFSFATDFNVRPTFVEGDNPFFVNGGKWIYFGRTADFDEPGLYFYDTESKARIYRSVPLEAYYSTHATEFVGQIEIKGKRLPLTIYEFLFMMRQRTGLVL